MKNLVKKILAEEKANRSLIKLSSEIVIMVFEENAEGLFAIRGENKNRPIPEGINRQIDVFRDEVVNLGLSEEIINLHSHKIYQDLIRPINLKFIRKEIRRKH